MTTHTPYSKQHKDWLYISTEPEGTRIPAEGTEYIASPDSVNLGDME